MEKQQINNEVQNIRVIVRCRPISSREKQIEAFNIIELDPKVNQIAIKNNQVEEKKIFNFDKVYSEKSTQEELYSENAYEIVKSVIEGQNGSIIAYGQTGMGKSFTIKGYEQDELQGILPRAVRQIFQTIKEMELLQSQNIKFNVKFSVIEIYNEQLRDLLDSNTKQSDLRIRESKETREINIQNLSIIDVQSESKLMELILKAQNNVLVQQTMMGQSSSRSTIIYQISVQSEEIKDGNFTLRQGKLNIVEMAGSERLCKTGVQGQSLKEATRITQSLCSLGNIIAALTNPKCKIVPYRDSKFTRILQDSFGGSAKTLFIGVIGPTNFTYDENLSTLRFVNRVRQVQNKEKKNIKQITVFEKSMQEKILLNEADNLSLISNIKNELKCYEQKINRNFDQIYQKTSNLKQNLQQK